MLQSGATVALLGDDRPDGVRLRDMGEHRLKDLAGAERVFRRLFPVSPRRSRPCGRWATPTFVTTFRAYATSFVGRAAELREVQALIGGGRLLTLVGVGGSGKTRACSAGRGRVARRRGRRRVAGGARLGSDPAQVAAKIVVGARDRRCRRASRRRHPCGCLDVSARPPGPRQLRACDRRGRWVMADAVLTRCPQRRAPRNEP